MEAGSLKGGLESISLDTLYMINCSKDKIKVGQNVCGLLPAMVELRDENRGNFFLNFRDIELLEDIIEGALFLKDFTNLIDLVKLVGILSFFLGFFLVRILE